MNIKNNNKGIGIVEYSLIIALLALIFLGIMITIGASQGDKLSLYVLEEYKTNQQMLR